MSRMRVVAFPCRLPRRPGTLRRSSRIATNVLISSGDRDVIIEVVSLTPIRSRSSSRAGSPAHAARTESGTGPPVVTAITTSSRTGPPVNAAYFQRPTGCGPPNSFQGPQPTAWTDIQSRASGRSRQAKNRAW